MITAPLTALPLLLALTYRAYWYCNYGDYLQDTPVLLRTVVRWELRCSEAT
jgi:hypothetical protein